MLPAIPLPLSGGFEGIEPLPVSHVIWVGFLLSFLVLVLILLSRVHFYYFVNSNPPSVDHAHRISTH